MGNTFRKPEDQRLVPRMFHIKKSVLQKIAEMSKAEGVSFATIARRLIDKALSDEN